MSLQIKTTAGNDASQVFVEGDVDLYTSPELRAALLKTVASARGRVKVNLGRVTYMDSSGVATLIEGLRAAREKKTAFALVAPAPAVLKVLRLARLDGVFDIVEA